MTTSEIPPFIRQWYDGLQTATLSGLAPHPALTAVFSADMINGFLCDGPLSSPRVDALAAPVVALVQSAWDHGVTEFVFLQDTHSRETPEFQAYPPHCVAGTDESLMIRELAELPFADHFTVIPKNSLNPAIATEFDAWLAQHPGLQTALVVGNCTDLCTYQLAMHLRLRANALDDRDLTVVVAANAVDTFDIPDGATGSAHPGDFFHQVFLYHMAQNGIRIVRSVEAG